MLDTQQNQLLYYDAEDETVLKGHVDLGEMKSARVITTPPSKYSFIEGSSNSNSGWAALYANKP